jgi:hypothetical protein
MPFGGLFAADSRDAADRVEIEIVATCRRLASRRFLEYFSVNIPEPVPATCSGNG